MLLSRFRDVIYTDTGKVEGTEQTIETGNTTPIRSVPRHAKSHTLSVILMAGASISHSHASLKIFNNSHTSYNSSDCTGCGFGVASTGNLCLGVV